MEAFGIVTGVVILAIALWVRGQVKVNRRRQVAAGVIILPPPPRVPAETLVKGYAWNIIGGGLVWLLGCWLTQLYVAGDPFISAIGLNEVPQNMLVLFGPWIGSMLIVSTNPFFPKGWLERPSRGWNLGDLLFAAVLLGGFFMHMKAMWPLIVS